MRALAHAEIIHTPLSCGGDSIPDSWLPNSDSLSLLIQSHIPTCILVCVCMFIFVLFLFDLLSTLQLGSFLYVSPQYRGLALHGNQLSALKSGVFAGLSSLQ